MSRSAVPMLLVYAFCEHLDDWVGTLSLSCAMRTYAALLLSAKCCAAMLAAAGRRGKSDANSPPLAKLHFADVSTSPIAAVIALRVKNVYRTSSN